MSLLDAFIRAGKTSKLYLESNKFATASASNIAESKSSIPSVS